MTTARPSTAVVVVNHGSHDLVRRNLTATMRGLDAFAVVVDNSPAPEARAAVAALARDEGWELVATVNDGFGAGVNRGVARAAELGADTVLVVNPDLALDPGVARALVDACRSEPRTLVSPRVDREDGAPWFSGGTLDVRTGRTRAHRGPASTGHAQDGDAPGAGRALDWLSGACLATATGTWHELGGFDDRYFLYWEDVDLGRRATDHGVRLQVRDDLVAVHAVGGTQETAGTRRKSDRYYEQNCRNRLVFAAHHLDRRTRLRWVLTAPAYAVEVLLRGGRRQLLASPRPALAVLRGTLGGAAYALRRRPAWPVGASRPGAERTEAR